jgi:hypothetical protein
MLTDGFDRRDRLAFRLGGQHHATVDRFSVNQDGARAAITCFASMLHTEDAQVFAQGRQQQCLGRKVQFDLFTIEGESDSHGATPSRSSLRTKTPAISDRYSAPAQTSPASAKAPEASRPNSSAAFSDSGSPSIVDTKIGLAP